MPVKTTEILQPGLLIRSESLDAFKPTFFLKETEILAETIKPSVFTTHESVLDQARDIVRKVAFKNKVALKHTLVNERETSLTSASILKLTQYSRGSERFRYRPRRPRRRRCPHNRLKKEGCSQCDENKKKSKL